MRSGVGECIWGLAIAGSEFSTKFWEHHPHIWTLIQQALVPVFQPSQVSGLFLLKIKCIRLVVVEQLKFHISKEGNSVLCQP